jgi:hypothetical protein
MGGTIMQDLIAIEHNNIRVLTTAQLSESYEASPEVVSNNFNRNRDRYAEGKHFYCLEGEAKRQFCDHHQFDDGSKKAVKLYLWTEKGALLHAKSLNTDKAWSVYDALVESYFTKKAAAPVSNIDLFELALKSIRDNENRVAALENKVEAIKDAIVLNPAEWRDETRRLIVKIAERMGGQEYISEAHKEVYKLVETRAGVRLGIRLGNMRNAMFQEGICKSKRDKLTKLDVIANDKKLVEIYTAIVKQMAIKAGVYDNVKTVMDR